MRPNVLERDLRRSRRRAPRTTTRTLDALRELGAGAGGHDALLPKYMRPDPDKAR